MEIYDFDYHLPAKLIAQHPNEPRDECRLMVVDRHSCNFQHSRFRNLPDFLSPRDLVVLNNTRVIPARLYASRKGQQDRIEVLLLRCVAGNVWEVLIRPGKKARPGMCLVFEPGRFEATVVDDACTAIRKLEFEYSGKFQDWINKLGEVPLPPYINRLPEQEDQHYYQTVFAQEEGSIAAPTAGLHFSEELLRRVLTCEITLHVGYGTFKPILKDAVEAHTMDVEHYKVGQDAAAQIKNQLAKNERVVTVGTTTTRALEHVFANRGDMVPDQGATDLFIYPGFKFEVTGALITNFHLPRSTLLLLVSAFAGKDLIEECYREAIDQKYRFYSYGDAMLIL